MQSNPAWNVEERVKMSWSLIRETWGRDSRPKAYLGKCWTTNLSAFLFPFLVADKLSQTIFLFARECLLNS
ncbi:hypothetical protein RRG08_054261 [Elysia crispata]|uniref:Uncharacterized protein n=1 Tax=Elysia crispata TaxID=231223 RepID=A0AAE0YCR7_9GAST|nr:hypothetical protein RRG08_054261 [Elysia crispata]